MSLADEIRRTGVYVAEWERRGELKPAVLADLVAPNHGDAAFELVDLESVLAADLEIPSSQGFDGAVRVKVGKYALNGIDRAVFRDATDVFLDVPEVDAVAEGLVAVCHFIPSNPEAPQTQACFVFTDTEEVNACEGVVTCHGRVPTPDIKTLSEREFITLYEEGVFDPSAAQAAQKREMMTMGAYVSGLQFMTQLSRSGQELMSAQPESPEVYLRGLTEETLETWNDLFAAQLYD